MPPRKPLALPPLPLPPSLPFLLQAIEHAFKNETIGLVTKAEFVQKRATLQDR